MPLAKDEWLNQNACGLCKPKLTFYLNQLFLLSAFGGYTYLFYWGGNDFHNPFFEVGFFIILVLHLWSINLFVLSEVGMNYHDLLYIVPRGRGSTWSKHDEWIPFSNYVCYLWLIWLPFFYLWHFDKRDRWAEGCFSLFIFVTCSVFTPAVEDRQAFFGGFWHVLTNLWGCKAPKWEDKFIADIMTSTVILPREIYRSTCILLTVRDPGDNPYDNCSIDYMQVIFNYLPAFLRFTQESRLCYEGKKSVYHAKNALKYTISMITLTISIVFPSSIFWFVSICISTLYSFYWDVKYDFGWFVLKYEQGRFHPIFYWFVLMYDLVGRLAWSLNLSTFKADLPFIVDDKLWFVTSTIEIFRRFFWIFLKLEYDAHKKKISRNNVLELNSCLTPIPLTPIYSNNTISVENTSVTPPTTSSIALTPGGLSDSRIMRDGGDQDFLTPSVSRPVKRGVEFHSDITEYSIDMFSAPREKETFLSPNGIQELMSPSVSADGTATSPSVGGTATSPGVHTVDSVVGMSRDV